jgi:hypothetical protein
MRNIQNLLIAVALCFPMTASMASAQAAPTGVTAPKGTTGTTSGAVGAKKATTAKPKATAPKAPAAGKKPASHAKHQRGGHRHHKLMGGAAAKPKK